LSLSSALWVGSLQRVVGGRLAGPARAGSREVSYSANPAASQAGTCRSAGKTHLVIELADEEEPAGAIHAARAWFGARPW